MFGWEFPPVSSGGLGTACFGLTKGMSNLGMHVTFVLPKAEFLPDKSHVRLLVASMLRNVTFKHVDSTLVPYIDSSTYQYHLENYLSCGANRVHASLYGRDLFEEVYRYAKVAETVAAFESFDIIHAHDWMTFPAAIAAKNVSGKPLVVHVHATDFDRTGGNPNQAVYDIERRGMHMADRVIAVSQFTKNIIVQHYGIAPEKVVVVHNAVEHGVRWHQPRAIIGKDRIVLFLGRITLQKGPDYFLDAAKLVLEQRGNVKFVIAGTGDMTPAMIEKAAHLGIAHRVLFAGFLTGEQIDRMYQMADLYVMPSVSEPFGITPLEALKNKTPVIISKQSGVSEVLKNCLKVDFWDVRELANKIISVLDHAPLHEMLTEEGHQEVQSFNWDESARKCKNVFEEAIALALARA